MEKNRCMEHLQIAVPVLACLDIDKTVKFYQENLGLDRVGRQNNDHVVIESDKIEIHFWKYNDKNHSEHTSCYLRVKDEDILYAKMRKADVVRLNGPLGDQPGSIGAFAILDEDGSMIKFGKNLYIC